jgi:hypothetical protein
MDDASGAQPELVPEPAPTTAPPSLCGPDNPAATEAPAEALRILQRMPLSWRLCYLWRAVERHAYHPERFVAIRRAYLQGYPATATSREVGGPGDGVTEVTIGQIRARSDGYDQVVEIELQIQFDGDYLDWRGAQVLDYPGPGTLRPPGVTFAAAFEDAGARGLLPHE